jgi:hypothetical protein
MIFFFLLGLLTIYLKEGGLRKSDLAVFGGYYIAIYACSSWSLSNLSLSGDETLYHQCGLILSETIRHSGLLSMDSNLCNAAANNQFVKLVGAIYFFFGESIFTLIGFNAFLIFLGTSIFLDTFVIRSEDKKRIFRLAIYLPPLIYLAVRPAKESAIAFAICLVVWAMNVSRLWLKVIAVFFAINVSYFLRWQLALGVVAALFVFWIWLGLAKLNNRQRIFALVLGTVCLISIWKVYQPVILNYLNTNFIYSQNVEVFANNPGSAMIYKLMLYGNGENSLHLWNVFIAHLGSLFTPHPFRFIRESISAGSLKAHIFEEFLLVSFWFYSLLPVYGLYFYETFVSKWKDISKIQNMEVFKFVFASMVFSLASFSLLFMTPQMFRYKIPLNIYLFVTILVFICQNGVLQVLSKFKKFRWMIASYFVVIAAYSVLYLAF